MIIMASSLALLGDGGGGVTAPGYTIFVAECRKNSGNDIGRWDW